jgi:hypothetical protein
MSPAVVEVPYLTGGIANERDKMVCVGARARLQVIGVDPQIVIVVYPGTELFECPLAQFWGEAKAATFAKSVRDGYSR